MKVALLADSHAGSRNDHPVFNDFFLKFFTETFFPKILEENIKTIIHLGDVFDRRKYINFQTLNSWRTNVFDVMQAHGITMHIILGNHDVYWKNTNEINSVEELIGSYDNIIIYKDPTTIEIDQTKILMLPWINSSNVEQTTKEIEQTSARLCCGHLEILGFEHFRGHINTDKGLDRKILDKFEMVFSGHFHLKSQQDNIWYLGSPYQMVWNDYGDDRGFHIFDTRTRDLDFIKNPNQIFDKITYDDENETFDNLLKLDFSAYKNKCIKLIVDKKTNIPLFEQFLELLEKENPIDVSIVEQNLYGIIEDEHFNQATDTLTLLVQYIDTLNIEAEIRNKVVDLVKSIYLEAGSLDNELI